MQSASISHFHDLLYLDIFDCIFETDCLLSNIKLGSAVSADATTNTETATDTTNPVNINVSK